MKKKILLVEDNSDLRDTLVETLGQDYVVKAAGTLTEAKYVAGLEKFDIFILDLGLPDGHGFQFCTFLKSQASTKDVPILILSGDNDVHSRVTGLDLGADDFLSKPFHWEELHSRIRVRLRRPSRSADEQIAYGPFSVNLKSQKVFLTEGAENRDLDLTSSEFRIFNLFVENIGETFSRDKLIAACFGDSYNVSARAIDVHVHALRKKLGNTHEFIKTVYGVGYIFELPVNTI